MGFHTRSGYIGVELGLSAGVILLSGIITIVIALVLCCTEQPRRHRCYWLHVQLLSLYGVVFRITVKEGVVPVKVVVPEKGVVPRRKIVLADPEKRVSLKDFVCLEEEGGVDAPEEAASRALPAGTVVLDHDEDLAKVVGQNGGDAAQEKVAAQGRNIQHYYVWWLYKRSELVVPATCILLNHVVCGMQLVYVHAY